MGNDYVRDRLSEFMNKLIDWGVAGFRVDAAKHMLPDDLEAIYNRLHNLPTEWFPANTRPFVFQEVWQLFIDTRKIKQNTTKQTNIACMKIF